MLTAWDIASTSTFPRLLCSQSSGLGVLNAGCERTNSCGQSPPVPGPWLEWPSMPFSARRSASHDDVSHGRRGLALRQRRGFHFPASSQPGSSSDEKPKDGGPIAAASESPTFGARSTSASFSYGRRSAVQRLLQLVSSEDGHLWSCAFGPLWTDEYGEMI